MAGGNHPKSSSNKAPSSSTASSHRKSRWENNNKSPANQKPNPSPANQKPNPSPNPKKPPTPAQSRAASDLAHGPPFPPPLPPYLEAPPPAYGFHMLDRRTIVLADGSVRSYFALPPDYDFTPRPPDLAHRFLRPEFNNRLPPTVSPEAGGRFRENREFWNRPDGPGGPMKRKYGVVEEEIERQRLQHLNPGGGNFAGTSRPFGDEMRAAKHMRTGGAQNVAMHKYVEVDQTALKKAFLNFVKTIFENPSQKKSYLEDGRHGKLQCIACRRSSKDIPNMHELIMHTYNSDSADLRVNHLGLHKALCVLMGWNYSKPPDNSKAYQYLPPDEAAANQHDLIMWPPMIILHNTNTGKSKDGRMEGLGNKAMDKIIRDLGCGTGKSKSLYGRDGHQGITLIKFASDQSGLKDAVRLAEYFEKENRGRKAWTRVQHMTSGKSDENNPSLVKVDQRTGEKQRILYGYLGTVTDLDKLDFETKKKVAIESQREYKASN